MQANFNLTFRRTLIWIPERFADGSAQRKNVKHRCMNIPRISHCTLGRTTHTGCFVDHLHKLPRLVTTNQVVWPILNQKRARKMVGSGFWIHLSLRRKTGRSSRIRSRGANRPPQLPHVGQSLLKGDKSPKVKTSSQSMPRSILLFLPWFWEASRLLQGGCNPHFSPISAKSRT